MSPEHEYYREVGLPIEVTDILRAIDECNDQFERIPFSEEWKLIRKEFRKGQRMIWRLAECPKIEPYVGYDKPSVNVIPPIGAPGSCATTLLVAIGLNDDVRTRLLEAIEHVAVKCRKTTQNVIFYAVKWDELAWMEHKDSFKKISVNTVLKLLMERPIILV